MFRHSYILFDVHTCIFSEVKTCILAVQQHFPIQRLMVTRQIGNSTVQNGSFHGEQGWAGGLRCGESPGTPSRGSPARRRATASARRRRLRPRLMRRRPGRRRRRQARISVLHGEVTEAGKGGGTPRRRGAAASPSLPPPPQLYEITS